ncbi:MAG TPA: glutamine synthetase, partial [Pseudolabrys sp.]|nr:glutamine synthetase [Pseudolabrys sp.]
MSSRPRKAVNFVEQHRLRDNAQAKAAEQVERIIRKEKLEVVRFSFADQHGVLRGKTLLAAEAV